MSDLITVIVPIYKVEKYLDECMESIVKQTYTNLQIIMVDDGSPDKCPQKCDEWENKDSRIEVIHKHNGGLSDARNAGLEIARGDMLYFADSDDYLDITMLEKMHNFLVDNQCDIVMCTKAVTWNNHIEYEQNDGTSMFFEGADILNNYLYHRNDFCSGVWNKLFRKELFDCVRYPMGVNSEDYFVYSIVYNRAKKMGYLKESLYYYRQRKGSICNTTINDQSFCKIVIASMVKENLEKVNCPNKKGIVNFNMQAYKDVLNDLIRCKASDELIKEYAGKFRKFFGSVLFDSNVKIKDKVKILTFMVAPVKYTNSKNKVIYGNKDKNSEYELFE